MKLPKACILAVELTAHHLNRRSRSCLKGRTVCASTLMTLNACAEPNAGTKSLSI